MNTGPATHSGEERNEHSIPTPAGGDIRFATHCRRLMNRGFGSSRELYPSGARRPLLPTEPRLGSPGSSRPRQLAPVSEAALPELESKPAMEMQDSSSADLLKELTRVQSRIPMMPFAMAGGSFLHPRSRRSLRAVSVICPAARTGRPYSSGTLGSLLGHMKTSGMY